MKIVIATWSYYPLNDGIQMVTQYQAEELVKLGHEVVVLTKYPNEYNEFSEVIKGVKIFRFRHKTFLKHELGEIKEFQQTLLRETKDADVFMAIAVQVFSFLWSRKILDQISCRKVLFMHGMREPHIDLRKLHDTKHFWKELLLTPYYNLFFKRHWRQIMKYDACCHLFKNDASYNYFEEHGFKNNYVVMNACEETMFEIESDENIQRVKEVYHINKPYFVHVANYCARKNQKEALEIYYKMKNNTCGLVCIGSRENDYVRMLQELNDKLSKEYPGKERAHILIGVPREDTVKLIKGAYATLLTSQNEYFPITIAESMAAGKPFIASNVGNVPMLPGGNIYHNEYELLYWMDYYADNREYVKTVGHIGRGYADTNMHVHDKVKLLENILEMS